MPPLGNMGSWTISHRVILILVSIILIGSFLRIYHLGTESIWFDEAASIYGSKENLVLVVQSSGRLHNQPPLYFVLLHFWMRLFGTSEIAVRSLSAIFGIISIFVIYQVGCQLFNWRVGLISSFLSAISCYHIYYSQEARAYSLLQLLTLLSFSFFIKVLRTDSRRALHFALLLLTNVCLAYTHPHGLFVIISQNVYFLLLWNRYKRLGFWFLGVLLGTVAFFSPWIPVLFDRASGIAQNFWLPEPSLKDIFYTIRDYASGNNSSIAFLIFSILCLVGLSAMRGFNGEWNRQNLLQSIKGLNRNSSLEFVEETLLLAVWFSFPIIIPFIVSQFSAPIYFPRYTISASPAFYLLVARGISAFNRRRAVFFLIILVSLSSLPGLRYYYSHYTKDQWRETASFIEHNSRAKDVIFTWPDNWSLAFNYYYKGNLEIFGIDKDVHDNKKIAAVLDKAIIGKERLWLVLSGGGTFYPRFLTDRFGSRSVVGERKFFRVVEVYLFDLCVESQRSPGCQK